MGYNIYYEGIVELDKPLDDETYQLIQKLQTTRRMMWDGYALERDGLARVEDIGYDGAFFFPNKNLSRKELKTLVDKYVINANLPPGNQPGLHGVWNITEDRKSLVWNRKEKSYAGHEWLQYLVKKILIPRGYKSKGIINWFGEFNFAPRKFHTIVEENRVYKKTGYHPNVNEPDIEGWNKEESKSYEKYHQQWINNLIERKVQFLHQKGDSSLSFNLAMDNHIIQAVLKDGELIKCNYLYRNLRRENDAWIHGESEYIQKHQEGISWSELPESAYIRDELLLRSCLNAIDAYCRNHPDYLDKGITL